MTLIRLSAADAGEGKFSGVSVRLQRAVPSRQRDEPQSITSGSTYPAAMPDASSSLRSAAWRRRQARTRQLGRQCCWVARAGVNGSPHPQHDRRVTLLCQILGIAPEAANPSLCSAKMPKPAETLAISSIQTQCRCANLTK